ncbi:MAG: hypothetical protein JW787_10360 [Sedimentisphaerales bacterium]|nr:hypothetical protein [Sedimentisphaerales bacterium]
MTKKVINARLITVLAALTLMMFSSGCQQDKINGLNAELAKTAEERDNLKSRINDITAAHEQLQQQYEKLVAEQKKFQEQITELTNSRDTVQKQLEKLTVVSDNMKGVISVLTESRDTAIDVAKKSQDQLKEIAAQLQTETKKVLDLQEQLKNVQDAFKEFQEKIKL